MADKNNDSTNSEWNPRYWLVFGIGIVYILLLGLFTYLFNKPL